MSEIKAIETVYKGYRFRSRLEARWGVFFDALGIQWEYEKEGFQLSNGEWYLPDFWLPTFSGGMWAEVKPDGGSFDTAEQLVRDSGQSIWLCEGVPAARVYYVAEPVPSCLAPKQCPVHQCYICPRVEWIPVRTEGIPNFDQAAGENRMFWQPGCENPDGSVPDDYLYDDRERRIPGPLLRAVVAARSARFEHGESPSR
jgi:hypothetical protein